MEMSQTTCKEIEKIINNLENKYSTGDDEIPIPIIKPISHIISPPLCNIINASFSQSTFPSKLKKSIITPIHKKGSKEDINNFRPISLLSIFSKIIEKVVKNRLVTFLEKNHILTPEQYGFRDSRNTTDAIDNFLNMVYKNIESKNQILGVFCDLTKAFDSVNHKKLIKKLEHYGIRNKSLQWFESYLSNRTHKVKLSKPNQNDIIEHYESNFCNLDRGIPQGTVLGPVLFIIYINDLKHCTNQALFTLFADDTSILITDKNKDQLKYKANNVLTAVHQWFSINDLSLNMTKTIYIQFNSPNNTPETITLSEISSKPTIQSTQQTRFLGVILDQNLTWNNHLDLLKSKLGSAIFALKSVRRTIGPEAAKAAYHGYFHSLIEYGLPFWGANNRIKEIFTLQKKALRATLNIKNQRTSCRGKFKNNNILTVVGNYILTVCTLIHKTVENYPHLNHNHQTRNKHKLIIPRVKHNSYAYMGVKLYNSIPEHTKQLELKWFKLKLKELIMHIEPYSNEEFLTKITTER